MSMRCSDDDLDAVEPSPQQDYDRLQLIDTDTLIVRCVRQAGEGSREYVELSRTLLEVGVGTLTNLRKKNLLFPTLQKRRIAVPRPPESWPKMHPGSSIYRFGKLFRILCADKSSRAAGIRMNEQH